MECCRWKEVDRPRNCHTSRISDSSRGRMNSRKKSTVIKTIQVGRVVSQRAILNSFVLSALVQDARSSDV